MTTDYPGSSTSERIKTIQYIFNSILENHRALEKKEMPLKQQASIRGMLERKLLYRSHRQDFFSKEELYGYLEGEVDEKYESTAFFVSGKTYFESPKLKKEFEQYCKEIEKSKNEETKTT